MTNIELLRARAQLRREGTPRAATREAKVLSEMFRLYRTYAPGARRVWQAYGAPRYVIRIEGVGEWPMPLGAEVVADESTMWEAWRPRLEALAEYELNKHEATRLPRC